MPHLKLSTRSASMHHNISKLQARLARKRLQMTGILKHLRFRRASGEIPPLFLAWNRVLIASRWPRAQTNKFRCHFSLLSSKQQILKPIIITCFCSITARPLSTGPSSASARSSWVTSNTKTAMTTTILRPRHSSLQTKCQTQALSRESLADIVALCEY